MIKSLGKGGLAILFALLALCVDVRADYVSRLDPNGDGYLSLRRGPGSSFGLVRKLYADTVLEVLDENGVWKKVQLEDGTIGWAHGNWISPGLPPGFANQRNASGQPAVAADVTVPLPRSTERQEIMETARVAAETHIGFAVGLRSDTLRMLDDWAYVQGIPTTAAGTAIDWNTTRFASEIRDGFRSDLMMVLMRRMDGAWVVAESIFGPTDVYWYGWLDQYALPEHLFFSEQEGLIPEADWIGPPSSPVAAGPVSAGSDTSAAPPSDPPATGPTIWRDTEFGFSLALPREWRVETSDQNEMHMVVALAPQSEAGVIVLAIKTGHDLLPERLLETVEPMLRQMIITESTRLSSTPRSINGREGIWARYSGTYLSDDGPLASTADAFYTVDEMTGYVVLTIVPDFLLDRWQPVVVAILESFGLPGAAAQPAPEAVTKLPKNPAVPSTGFTVELLRARLPIRADGQLWGVALARDASRSGSAQSKDVTARYFGFAPDGAEPFETDLDLVVFEGPEDRLDALFAEYRTAPGARPLPLSSQAIEIAADSVEFWVRLPDGLVRIKSPQRELALSFVQTLAP